MKRPVSPCVSGSAVGPVAWTGAPRAGFRPRRLPAAPPRSLRAAGLLALLAGLCAAAPGSAAALDACTADDIIAQDGANCPAGSGPCTIRKSFNIGPGCTLDFGARAVTLANLATLAIGTGPVTIRAGDFTVAAGGFIDGRGTASTPPRNAGATLFIRTARSFAVQRGTSTGRINVSGTAEAGSVTVTAETTVTIDGTIEASSLGTSDGGMIDITAGGNLLTRSGSALRATGAGGGAGGIVFLTAAGSIDLGGELTLDGYDGGQFEAIAGGTITLGSVSARGTGAGSGTFMEPGLGGMIDATAGTSLRVVGRLFATGTRGGCGGCVGLWADYGDIRVEEQILANATLPEPEGGGAGGGMVTLSTTGSVIVTNTGRVAARSDGGLGIGGVVCADAGQSITAGGVFDASGGACGGVIEVTASGAITTTAAMDASGRNPGGVGGIVSVTAANNGLGTLSVGAPVTVAGGGCSSLAGCGEGGEAFLEGCDVTVQSVGSVDARAPGGGGLIVLTAREQLRVAGPVRANSTGSGPAGTVRFEFPSRKQPLVTTGQVLPPAVPDPRDTCTGPPDDPEAPAVCLAACPTCGDGVVEYPETCDNAPVSCDGCSAFCRIEDCDDGSVCTIDSCEDPMLGCRHVVIPACSPATPTPSPSPTPTPTPTPAFVPIAGSVRYNTSGVPVPAVSVALGGAASGGALTGGAGTYAFTAVPRATVHLEPAKTDDHRSAVSALDAAYVLQHVVGSRPFTGRQAVACDVTGNGIVSALDASRILQFVVGLLSRFDVATACNADWAFFPEPAAVPNQILTAPQISAGSCQRGRIGYAPLTGPATGQDFAAVLFGDCTLNWQPPAAGGFAPAAVTIGAARVGRGGEIRVPLALRQGVAFRGLSLTLRYDAAILQALGAHARGRARGALFAANTRAPGVIRVAMASADPVVSAGEPVLLLRFAGRTPAAARARIDVETVSIDESQEPARY